jgi:hypothetical protein
MKYKRPDTGQQQGKGHIGKAGKVFDIHGILLGLHPRQCFTVKFYTPRLPACHLLLFGNSRAFMLMKRQIRSLALESRIFPIYVRQRTEPLAEKRDYGTADSQCGAA